MGDVPDDGTTDLNVRTKDLDVRTTDLDVIVSGGSMGGLFTGIALDRSGHDVAVYEQSAGELSSRGGGIVAQPNILRFLREYGDVPPGKLTTETSRRQYLDRDGGVARERRESMTFTSWDAVYRRLRSTFPDDRYHAGEEVVGVDAEAGVARFEDESDEQGDLLVVAEGGQSSTRQQLLSEVSAEFADYVAWRGVVPEADLRNGLVAEFEDSFTFYQGPDLLILAYLIPGPNGGVAPGERRLNWVWYDAVGETFDREELMTDANGTRREFTVPPGEVREPVVSSRFARADESLPSVFSRLVRATEDPFVQAIYDLSVPRMVLDRTCLLGDAAFVARPHTAAGTAKAAGDATALDESLNAHDRLDAALEAWEDDRLAYGRRLVARGKEMGDQRLGLAA